jgi:ribulose kinase
MIAGLTLEHGQDALARRYLATVQALAYGTREIIEALNEAGHHIEYVAMCGGGAKNALSLREHADATGCDLHLAAENEAVALGAAILAATASGAFTDIQSAAAAMARPGDIIRANPARRDFHDAKYTVFRALCQDWQRYRDMMCANKGR